MFYNIDFGLISRKCGTQALQPNLADLYSSSYQQTKKLIGRTLREYIPMQFSSSIVAFKNNYTAFICLCKPCHEISLCIIYMYVLTLQQSLAESGVFRNK